MVIRKAFAPVRMIARRVAATVWETTIPIATPPLAITAATAILIPTATASAKVFARAMRKAIVTRGQTVVMVASETFWEASWALRNTS